MSFVWRFNRSVWLARRTRTRDWNRWRHGRRRRHREVKRRRRNDGRTVRKVGAAVAAAVEICNVNQGLLKMGYSDLFFFYFRLFNKVYSRLTNVLLYKNSPMTGFEPRISEVGSNHSTNWATTTAQQSRLVKLPRLRKKDEKLNERRYSLVPLENTHRKG